DPPRATDSIDPAELLSIWDGTGIIVTPEPRGGSVWVPPLEGLAAFAMISCLLMVFRSRGALTALVGTCLIGASIWLIFSFCAGLISLKAVRNTVGVHNDRPIVEMEWEEVRSAVDDSGVTIVDARQAQAFQTGHIDNAVNIPVT